MRKTSQLSWVLALGGVLFCTAARADLLLDPATLHIGPGAGTSCATGGCPLYNNEVNAFTPGTLDIYQNANDSNGNSGGLLTDPVLLILAVPNAPANLDMSGAVTGASLIAPYPGGTTTSGIGILFGTTNYGISDPTGYAGSMTSGDVYGFLGGDLTHGDNSNSFTNLSGWDSAVLGINATSFGIYVYELQTNQFAANDLLNVSLSGIPQGTFAVAFGESADKNQIYDNAFTEAGLETLSPPHPPARVPEPSTLALFGALLLALAGVRARLGRA